MTRTPQPPSFHVDNIDPDNRDMLVGMLDMQAELSSIRRMRRWSQEALAPSPGERALDVGSGTGSEVVALAAAVGPVGEAIGVDPNPGMVALASERAAATGSSARFVDGTAYALPFGDDHFDVVRCERVYQHLDHPDRATAEIARVTRPGGRVLLIDSDWATMITHPGDPVTLNALRQMTQGATPNPHSGRRLRGLLAAAGFEIDDIGSQAVLFDPDTLLEPYRTLVDRAVNEHVITDLQRDRLLDELAAGIASGDYHFSITMFAVLAHLPTR